MSFGAGRPGTAAVVITTSKSGIRSSRAACCCACCSGVSSLAYPPAVSSARTPRSRKVAPRLCTCSATAGRTSNAETSAPRRRAVAIAWRPATPAPMTSARTGAIVPAAVMSMGKRRGTRSAARTTALYPATVAWDDSASMDCARVIRGIDSIAKATTPRSRSRAMPSESLSGSRNPITTVPGASDATTSAEGDATHASASAPVVSEASVGELGSRRGVVVVREARARPCGLARRWPRSRPRGASRRSPARAPHGARRAPSPSEPRLSCGRELYGEGVVVVPGTVTATPRHRSSSASGGSPRR